MINLSSAQSQNRSLTCTVDLCKVGLLYMGSNNSYILDLNGVLYYLFTDKFRMEDNLFRLSGFFV